MLVSTEYRELRNSKRYQKSIELTISDHGSTEEIANTISSENVEGEVSEVQTLTQEAADEQIRGFICSSNPPARGVDSAGTRIDYHTASESLPQD